MTSISKRLLIARTACASSSKWVPARSSPSFPHSYCSAPSLSEVQPLPPQPIFGSQTQAKKRGWTRFLLFVPGALTFGLGTWQIIRRQEKVKMLEYRQSRLGTEPINCNNISLLGENMSSLEFRRVVCKGVFDDAKSIFVGPRSRSISGVTENGYYLITPLMPVHGSPESLQMPILVNRGWVPRSWRDKSVKALQEDGHPSSAETPAIQESGSWWRFWYKKPDTTEENVGKIIADEVVGVVRGSEKPSIFVPANDPTSFQWFYVDVASMARCCGLPENTMYVEAVNEKVNPSNPYPIPKDTNALIHSSVMPQDHLNYTLTWYSLSAAVTFMAFKRLQPKKSMDHKLRATALADIRL